MKISMMFCVLASLVPAVNASAGLHFPRGPVYPPCAFGVFNDSYGRGVEDGFKATSLRAKLLDESCYQMGVESGRATRAADTWSFCTHDFDHGRKAGYEVASSSEPSSCFNQGYVAGTAALDIDAREGNAPAECQDAYKQGRDEARMNETGIRPDGRVAAHCYDLGRYDGSSGL